MLGVRTYYDGKFLAIGPFKSLPLILLAAIIKNGRQKIHGPIFALNIVSRLQLDHFAERLKPMRQNVLMDFIYNLTKLSLKKLTRDKQHLQTLHYVPKKYRPFFRQISDMTDLLYLHGTSRHTHKQIYCTICLILMLWSENMLDTYKMKVCWLN